MIKLKIAAAKNSGNETVFNIVDADNNPVNLTTLGATVVTVSVCGAGCLTASIDSDSDSVSFSGDTVRVKFGKLNLPPNRGGQTYVPKISYVTATNDEAEVIAGEGYQTQIELRLVC